MVLQIPNSEIKMITESKKALERARKHPAYMRSDEFIHTRLFDYDLHTMLLEMGPNCNLQCFHCSDYCGPNRMGLPDSKLVREAMTAAIRAGVLHTSLTSGEPLREENRGVVAMAAKYSAFMANMNIITNATFANRLEDAVDWINFLKENEFDMSRDGNNLCVSVGKMYTATQDNFRHINDALRVIHPDKDIGRNLIYQFIGVGDVKDAVKKVNELIVTINESFGKRRSERMGKHGDEDAAYVYPTRGSPIKIIMGQIEPHGRARELPLFERIMPKKRLELGDITTESEPVGRFHVFYNGDVHFTDCKSVMGRNMPYGNVGKEHLGEIMHKMRMDPVFQGFKLGGTPLLYFVAQKLDSKFYVEGRTNYDVNRVIFDDKVKVNEIRKYLSSQGVVDSYKKFVNSVDLRRPGFHTKEFIKIPQKQFH